jgi:hypothetical protein
VPEFGQFAFNFFGVSLSANGAVALWLAVVPVTLILGAFAIKIARSTWNPSPDRKE